MRPDTFLSSQMKMRARTATNVTSTTAAMTATTARANVGFRPREIRASTTARGLLPPGGEGGPLACGTVRSILYVRGTDAARRRPAPPGRLRRRGRPRRRKRPTSTGTDTNAPPTPPPDPPPQGPPPGRPPPAGVVPPP